MARKKTKKIASPVKSLRGQEILYQKQLNKLGRLLIKAIREEVLPYLKANQESYVLDGVGDQLSVIFNKLNEIGHYFPMFFLLSIEHTGIACQFQTIQFDLFQQIGIQFINHCNLWQKGNP